MPRLNNKDYTVEELERVLFLISGMMNNHMIPHEVIDELKPMIDGSEFTNFEKDSKPKPILWNFKFEMLMAPESQDIADMIMNAMRSSEVNENIKKRFGAMVREEVNWYIDRVKYFTVKGDTNILE